MLYFLANAKLLFQQFMCIWEHLMLWSMWWWLWKQFSCLWTENTWLYLLICWLTHLGKQSNTCGVSKGFDSNYLFSNFFYYHYSFTSIFLWTKFNILEPDVLSKTGNCQNDTDFIKRAKSLFVIVSSPPGEAYENFTEKVRAYNLQKPFEFPSPRILSSNKYVKVISSKYFFYV